MEHYRNLHLKDIEYFNHGGKLTLEKWKNIIGYEGIYLVSDLGRIKSFQLKKEAIIKGWADTYGYRTITLRENKKLKPRAIHRIVAESFLNHKPNGTNQIVVDHKNNIKDDNRLTNLQLVSNRENSSKDRVNGSSNYRGVTWNKNSKKWRSQMSIDGKRIGLGYFKSEIEASEAYQERLESINKNKNYG